MITRRFRPAGPLRGSLRPPPDKSISHRAALIAAMAEGETTIEGYLDAADTRSTLAAVEALGAEVVVVGEDRWVAVRPGWDGPPPDLMGAPSLGVSIRGVGLRAGGAGTPGPRSAAIDVGNAGTLLRLLPGWLAGQRGGKWTLDGDESIRRRPVDRVAEPLALMGAQVSCRENRFTPVEIEGAPLRGIDYELPVASAQVKSCLLFAGLLADGETRIVEPQPTRDHTERMLLAAGAEIGHEAVAEPPGRGDLLAGARFPQPAPGEAGGRVVSVQPCERLAPGEIAIPTDFSSAAFFLVAALLVPGSEIELAGVGLNPTRTGLLSILRRMGAQVDVELEDERGGESSGLIRARHSELRGTEAGGAEIPLAIDELPLVALAACFAEGETTIRDAAELRRKESDRIATVSEALNALGASVETTADGMRVEGGAGLRGGAIDAHGDHRIAMLGAVAGLASQEGVEVHGMDAAAISYPGFEGDLAALARTVS